MGVPQWTSDHIAQLASSEDLLGTKLKVILQRIEAKDYIDTAAILESGTSLAFGLGAERMPQSSCIFRRRRPRSPYKAGEEQTDCFRINCGQSSSSRPSAPSADSSVTQPAYLCLPVAPILQNLTVPPSRQPDTSTPNSVALAPEFSAARMPREVVNSWKAIASSLTENRNAAKICFHVDRFSPR